MIQIIGKLSHNLHFINNCGVLQQKLQRICVLQSIFSCEKVLRRQKAILTDGFSACLLIKIRRS